MKNHWRESPLSPLFSLLVLTITPSHLLVHSLKYQLVLLLIRLPHCASPFSLCPSGWLDFRWDRVNISHGLYDRWQDDYDTKREALLINTQPLFLRSGALVGTVRALRLTPQTSWCHIHYGQVWHMVVCLQSHLDLIFLVLAFSGQHSEREEKRKDKIKNIGQVSLPFPLFLSLCRLAAIQVQSSLLVMMKVWRASKFHVVQSSRGSWGL